MRSQAVTSVRQAVWSYASPLEQGNRAGVISTKGAEMENRDQVEGEIKEQTGELTDDESKESEGKAQETWGDAKEKGSDLEDEVRDRI